MNGLCATLRDTWHELGLEPRQPPVRLSCLLRTPRFRASSHVLFFVFAGGAREPLLVAKTPRLTGDHAFLDREAANLRALALLGEGGIDGVPRALAYRDWQGSKLLLQTALGGRPMSPAVVRERPERCMQAVMRWVTDLHLATRAFHAGESIRAAIERCLGRLEAAFPEFSAGSQLVDRTRQRVEPLGVHVLPRVFEHGDLSAPNILVDGGGRIGVVDWELADPAGLPAVDVFFFLTYIAFARADANDSGRHVEAFADAFFGPHAWARPVVAEYGRALALPARILRPLFLLSWARYVSGIVGRLHDASPTLTEDRQELVQWLSTNRYFGIWRHTLDHWDELDF